VAHLSETTAANLKVLPTAYTYHLYSS